MNMLFELTLSAKGIPCMWESGGGWTNTGSATVISGRHGEAKTAIHIRTNGERCNANHALIPIKVGYHVVHAEHENKKDYFKVYRIENINLSEGIVECQELTEIPCNLLDAINACIEKSYDYHCRDPFYCK